MHLRRLKHRNLVSLGQIFDILSLITSLRTKHHLKQVTKYFWYTMMFPQMIVVQVIIDYLLQFLVTLLEELKYIFGFFICKVNLTLLYFLQISFKMYVLTLKFLNDAEEILLLAKVHLAAAAFNLLHGQRILTLRRIRRLRRWRYQIVDAVRMDRCVSHTHIFISQVVLACDVVVVNTHRWYVIKRRCMCDMMCQLLIHFLSFVASIIRQYLLNWILLGMYLEWILLQFLSFVEPFGQYGIRSGLVLLKFDMFWFVEGLFWLFFMLICDDSSQMFFVHGKLFIWCFHFFQVVVFDMDVEAFAQCISILPWWDESTSYHSPRFDQLLWL